MGGVQFKAILMDQGAGFQQNSTVQIWTSHNDKIFNIVHIHVNDCSEEVPIDVQYLAAHDYKVRDIPFGKDFSGRHLRYKILVHDWKIRDVLYNTGSSIETVMFQEHPVPLAENKIAGNCFGRVTKVPYAMLTSPSKEYIENVCPSQMSLPLMLHCQQRGFERLLGYVEFEILGDAELQEVFESPQQVGVAVCKLQQPPKEALELYEILS